MKKIFLAVLCTVGFYGNGIYAEVVELAGHTSMQKCTTGNGPNNMCSIHMPVFVNIRLELKKIYQDPQDGFEAWSGEWNDTIEEDGVSYLANVTIDKTIHGPTNTNYYVTVSLALNTSGVEPDFRKVQVSVDSLDKLNSVILVGESVIVAHTSDPATYQYTGSLGIGPKL